MHGLRFARWFPALILAFSTIGDVAAISSCQVGAGIPVGAGDSGTCTLGGPTALEAEYTNFVSVTAAAGLSLASGSMHGSASVFDAVGSARFYGEIIQTVRISGPATSAAVPVTFGFVAGGDFSVDCIACNGDLGARFTIANETGPFLLLEKSVGATTGSSGWTINSSAFGPGASTSGGPIDPTHVGGGLTFDARTLLGHSLRVTVQLSGNAHITAVDPFGPNAITVNATNTALFNFFLPDGYSLSAIGSPGAGVFLSSPTLQQPVPLPGAVWLLISAVGLIRLRWCRT